MSDVLAFSPEQVCRLTGLSGRQLRYWDDTEFFTPAFREEAKRSPFARVYSYRDVVGLRALAEMRRIRKIPLQTLRRVGQQLRRYYDEPWSQLVFYIVGKTVFYQNQESVAIRNADQSGQELMPFELVRVEGDVRKAVETLRRRGGEQVGQITRHRYVAENRPVLAGTRIPTVAIREFHDDGYSLDDILRAYPHLRPEDIAAALEYERKRLKKAS